MGFFTVNKAFIPIKLHYAMFNAGCGTVQPVMPVYAKYLGFSSFVVGTIYTILPLLGLLIKPAFGALADKFKWHRGVLLAWELIVMLVYFGIWFIPRHESGISSTQLYYKDPGVASICTSINSPAYFRLDKGDCMWTCELTSERCLKLGIGHTCDEFAPAYHSLGYLEFIEKQETCLVLGNKTKTEPWKEEDCSGYCQRGKGLTKEESDEETFKSWQFWLFLVLLLGAWSGTAVITTLSDTICIEICEDPFLYGKQRLWGSMGWGVWCIVNGFLIDAVSVEGEEKNYAPAFYLMIGPFLIDIFVSYKYLKVEIPAQSKSIVKDVWKVTLNIRNAIFMFWCAMAGISIGILWNFVFWLLEDLAAAQGPDVTAQIKTIEGLVGGLQSFIGEVPAFFFGGWLVGKIGHYNSITLIFALVGLRYTLYSFLTNPWWCLPIEILQTNFGLFYSTMTSYAKKMATPGTEATIQSVLCAICEGIGVAVGSFIAGLIYDTYGGSTCFRVFGIFFFVLAVLNIFIDLALRRYEKVKDSSISTP